MYYHKQPTKNISFAGLFVKLKSNFTYFNT